MNLSADLQNVMQGHPDSDDESDHGQSSTQQSSQHHELESEDQRGFDTFDPRQHHQPRVLSQLHRQKQ